MKSRCSGLHTGKWITTKVCHECSALQLRIANDSHAAVIGITALFAIGGCAVRAGRWMLLEAVHRGRMAGKPRCSPLRWQAASGSSPAMLAMVEAGSLLRSKAWPESGRGWWMLRGCTEIRPRQWRRDRTSGLLESVGALRTAKARLEQAYRDYQLAVKALWIAISDNDDTDAQA